MNTNNQLDDIDDVFTLPTYYRENTTTSVEIADNFTTELFSEYMKCFYHLLDMTLVNSWLIYKKVNGNKLTLAKFKEEVAVSLCQQYKKPTRGRPSSTLENELVKRKKRKPSAHVPNVDVRLNGLHH